jgi:ATP-binding protein involved in chromosome partitioning
VRRATQNTAVTLNCTSQQTMSQQAQALAASITRHLLATRHQGLATAGRGLATGSSPPPPPPQQQQQQQTQQQGRRLGLSGVQHVVAVASGKGGVGKSTVAGAAAAVSKWGLSLALLSSQQWLAESSH